MKRNLKSSQFSKQNQMTNVLNKPFVIPYLIRKTRQIVTNHHILLMVHHSFHFPIDWKIFILPKYVVHDTQIPEGGSTKAPHAKRFGVGSGIFFLCGMPEWMGFRLNKATIPNPKYPRNIYAKTQFRPHPRRNSILFRSCLLLYSSPTVPSAKIANWKFSICILLFSFFFFRHSLIPFIS